jgi:hypothetical protein
LQAWSSISAERSAKPFTQSAASVRLSGGWRQRRGCAVLAETLYCLFQQVFLLPAMWLAWNYSLTATRHCKCQTYLAIRDPVHCAQD